MLIEDLHTKTLPFQNRWLIQMYHHSPLWWYRNY